MGLFKKTKFESENKEVYDVYEPTIFKKDSIEIKGKDKLFMKLRR